jgi:hypothetical protein
MKEYSFIVICITDSGTVCEKVWSRKFDNAIEAVNCYESFVDHATCVLDRVVTLSEPNGHSHTKVFKYPYGSDAAYEEACGRWRHKQAVVSSIRVK